MSTVQEWPEATKKLIAATVGKGLKPEQLAQLQHIALSRGLDPLNSELYAIPKGGGCTFIASINGMLKVVAAELDGIDCTWYDDQAQAFPIWLPKAPPTACSVTVYRRGCTRGFTNAVRFDDYRGSNLWQKMPSVMIRKCALAGALRLAFSDLLSGLYAQEEMDQAGFQPPAAAPAQEEVEAAPAPKAGTAAKPRATAKKAPAAAAAKASSADAAAESLAQALGGNVVEQIREACDQDPAEFDSAPLKTFKFNGGSPELPKLLEVCIKHGMTNLGWRTLLAKLRVKQAEDLEPSRVSQGIMALTREKVAELNAGGAPASAS